MLETAQKARVRETANDDSQTSSYCFTPFYFVFKNLRGEVAKKQRSFGPIWRFFAQTTNVIFQGRVLTRSFYRPFRT